MEETPYDDLIGDGDIKGIQERYETHRTKRNADQRQKLLGGDLTRLAIDETLYKLLHPEKYPGFVDPRHCLVFWARPPPWLVEMIAEIQARLRTAAPNLWPLPLENLHMTAMEITHSQTESTIAGLVEVLRPRMKELTSYLYDHRTRLVKPMIGFDASALALSFVPAAGEGARSDHDDAYTYHHLRRDLWRSLRDSGMEVASRYVLPSAHLTVARFVTNADHSSSTDFDDLPNGDGKLDLSRMETWLDKIDEINAWLKDKYWPREATGDIPHGGEWIVGEAHGLDLQAGTIWYGRPSSGAVSSGRGFEV